MYDDTIYQRNFSEDAYIIYLYNPQQPQAATELKANQDVTFILQKYRLSPDGNQYTPLFRRGVCLNFHINHLETVEPRDYTLPIRFDGYPRAPFPVELSIEARQDNILHIINSHTRLVFRYSPVHQQGCLLHFGYDFAELDKSPLNYLWISASNRYTAEAKFLRSADDPTEPTDISPSEPSSTT